VIGTVILTRSDKENERVAPLFQREGFDVVSAPTIELRPLTVEVDRAERALEGGGGVVLTSAAATERWLDLRRGAYSALHVDCYIVVGERSSQMLRERDADVPIAVVADSSAELLRSEVQFPRRLLYPGSRARREDMVAGLRVRGSSVVELPLYEPVLPADGGRSFVSHLRSARPPLAVVFFSPSAVEGMHALAVILRPGTVIGAIGQTTASALRMRGYEDIVVPERPDADLLARALRQRMTSSS